MILSALHQYYQRLLERGHVPPLGYSEENISYALVLNEDGELVDVQDVRDTSGRKPRGRRLAVPQSETRTSGIKPLFLWDKTSYVLGVSAKAREGERQRERTAGEHQAFKEVHQARLGGSEDAGLRAILLFLKGWTPERFVAPLFSDEVLDASLVFRLQGEHGFVHQRPAAMALQAAQIEDAQSPERRCLITGAVLPIARLHSAIKGVDGAQSSGAHIVSFNQDAFTSYGKKQGENAPASEQAVFGYTTVLNHLLRRDPHNRQRLRVGDTTVIFWAVALDSKKAETAESLFAALAGTATTDEQEVARMQTVLDGVARGRPLADLDPDLDPSTRFCVLGLAPNASRLSIRFWLQDDFGLLVDRFAQHNADLMLHPTPWKTPPALWRLLRATAAQGKTENIPPQLAGELMRAILTGGSYPASLLANMIMRMRADRDISGLRVALCKAVLARQARKGTRKNQEEVPVSLDKESTHPGYRLGRLFAVLEGAQRAALGRQINATIRDRYYGAASATPASVFPMLLRNTAHHLSKLRKDGKGGLAHHMERDMAEIIDGIAEQFPRSLRMEDQGRFAIGYYHQAQTRFTKGNEAAAGPDTDTEQGEDA